MRVDAAVLKGGSGLCELLDGTPLSPETVRRLSCDTAKVLYRTDEADCPRSISPRMRTVPTAVKRALIQRDDGRCRFPGCCSHLFLEAHHLVHWADGGPTILENLILLCWRHHTWQHEGEDRLTVGEDGCAIFRNAFGDLLCDVPGSSAA